MTQRRINLGAGQVKIEFTSKPLTSYGGFSLLKPFFDNIHLKEAIEKIIPVEEISNNKIEKYDKVIGYILTVLSGGNRFSHQMHLGDQEIIKKLFGLKRIAKSSTTLSRYFGKIKKWSQAEILSENIWEYESKLIPWTDIKEDWLGLDSSVLIRYGKQEGAKRGYNPKKQGRPCHTPLLAFMNKHKYVINIWNRRGDVSSNNNSINFFNSVYNRLQGKIKLCGVLCDNGFYDLKFIKELERNKLIYIIGARLQSTLQKKIYSINNWENIADGIQISTFNFKHTCWIEENERRYIVVRQEINKRPQAMGKQLTLFEMQTEDYRYGCYITNSPEDSKNIWEHIKPRGDDENTIKELKEDFALNGFSMNSFYATEAAMQLRILIYNIFVLFRDKILQQTEKREQLKTIKYKYLIIPAQLGTTGREIILRLYVKASQIRDRIINLFQRISEYKPYELINCNAVEI